MKRVWNESKYEKMVKEGYGQGALNHYKPWVDVFSFPSQGRVGRIHSKKIGREIHSFSELETNYIYIFDWLEDVIDIREQYPLDLKETIKIANDISVRHPCDNKSGFEYVLTTDLLIVKKQTTIARSIKYSKDLNNKRTLEKLEVEHLYWKNKNIDWKLLTEKQINAVFLDNIKYLRGIRLDNLQYTKEQLFEICKVIVVTMLQWSQRIFDMIEYISYKLRLETDDCYCIIRWLISEKILILDVTKIKFDKSALLKDFQPRLSERWEEKLWGKLK
ncbi:TnsA endonuclease N-terminal domain-containing protein [Bacillus sp. D386]|uniref:TnsA endonuclease N-terminal domain-containing protein n=1 Tax=Bacillus sp. D386 TaxID=2587155 RepID=UPI00111DA13C|nr:TnsA endonuclease N-terminal domain-containing protein [Bacillus sp. D386]